MKLYLGGVVILFISAYCHAICNFVVYNVVGDFESNSRIVELDGDSGFAPLCSDLPKPLRQGIYAKFCSTDNKYNTHAIYFSPFTAVNCQSYINTHWAIIDNDVKIYEHEVKPFDLLTNKMIFLYFPFDFNQIINQK
jgi:hypothetical protein